MAKNLSFVFHCSSCLGVEQSWKCMGDELRLASSLRAVESFKTSLAVCQRVLEPGEQ